MGSTSLGQLEFCNRSPTIADGLHLRNMTRTCYCRSCDRLPSYVLWHTVIGPFEQTPSRKGKEKARPYEVNKATLQWWLAMGRSSRTRHVRS